jgi:predicted MFS family arabinose efflux permease
MSFVRDRFLIKPKIAFLTLLSQVAVVFMYRCILYRQEFNLSTKHYGLICFPRATFFSMGSWMFGYLADRLNRPRAFLLLSSALVACAYVSLKLVPKQVGEYEPTTFWSLMVISCAISFLAGPLMPLLDKIGLAMLHKEGATDDQYGAQRAWGSIGELVTTLAVSILLSGHEYFYLYAANVLFSVLFIVTGFLVLPSDRSVAPPSKSNDMEKKKPAEAKEEPVRISKLLGNSTLMLFLLIAFLNGTARYLGYHFVDNFLEDTVDGMSIDKSYIAWIKAGNNVAEITILFLSTPIIRKFGPWIPSIIANVAMFAKMAILGSLPVGESFNWVYFSICWAAEFVSGISFSTMIFIGVIVSDRESPRGLKSTAQSLFSGIYHGLTASIGGLIGYLVIDNDVPMEDGMSPAEHEALRRVKVQSNTGFFANHSGAFRLSAILCLVAMVLSVIQFLIQRRRKH